MKTITFDKIIPNVFSTLKYGIAKPNLKRVSCILLKPKAEKAKAHSAVTSSATDMTTREQ